MSNPQPDELQLADWLTMMREKSQKEQKDLLSQLFTDQKNFKIQALKHPSPVNPFNVALGKLQIKAVQHWMRAKQFDDNDRYYLAGKTAMSLYFKMMDKKQAPQREKYIEEASKVLSQHRGFKQILLDLLNSLLHPFSKRSQHTFFQARTESMKIVEEIKTSMPKP